MGVGSIFTSKASVGRSAAPGDGLRLMRPEPASTVVGVGQNPDPLPLVRGTDTASRNKQRPDFITCSFQVSEHSGEAQTDVVSNIFTKDPAGPQCVNKAEHLRPERTVICRAAALPGGAVGLAGVAAGNNVNWRGVVDIVNVEVLMGVRKMPAADGVAERVALDRPTGMDASLTSRQREPTNAVEQRPVGELPAHAAGRW
jgi:hypothetical protein